MAAINETPRSSARWFMVLLGMGIVVSFFGLVVLWQGRVQGEEFSPDSFFTRRFTYQRIPGIGTSISATKLVPLGGSLACDAEVAKHLTAAVSNPRWDIATSSLGGRDQPDGDALILLNHLRAQNVEGKSRWGDWSKSHPVLAAELWPAVQDMAKHRAYFAIPELMEFAAEDPALEELRSAIRRIGQGAAKDLASQLIKEDKVELALETVRWGLGFGAHTELDQMRIQLQP
jgi:hypothetical protein